MNIAAIFIDEPAAKHPSRHAIAGHPEVVTYRDLLDLTNRAANSLLKVGCIAGDRVLLMLPDSAQLVASFFGCAKIGAIPVPVGVLSRPEDYSYYLADTRAKVVLVQASALSQLTQIERSETVKILVAGDTKTVSLPNAYAWDDLVASAPTTFISIQKEPDDPATLLYTSGSTGRQKGVVHSHRNLIAAARNVGHLVFGINQNDRVLSVSKLAFSFGLGFGMYFPLACGAATILNPAKVDVDGFVELVHRYRPTVVAAVPSFLVALLKLTRTNKPDLSSLRFIVSAGEPLSVPVFAGFREQFGIEVVDGIGSTEMCSHFISSRPGAANAGTCGTGVPGCSLKLLDDGGQEVRNGDIGELWVNSESAFLGYWEKPQATTRVKNGEWFDTGDRLYRDDAGRFHYCGRNDDMLKVSGMWVSSREIECILCEHPAIERAVVTVKEDGTGVRRLVAYVVASEGNVLRRIDLLKYVGAKLPEHMIPADFVILKELPLTSNGKLLRAALPIPHSFVSNDSHAAAFSAPD